MTAPETGASVQERGALRDQDVSSDLRHCCAELGEVERFA